MSKNWLGKTTAGILIIATLLLASPAPFLAAPAAPAPAATPFESIAPVGTPEPPSNTGGQSGGSTTIINPATSANNSSSSTKGSYVCGNRKFSISEFFWNLLPNNVVTTFFQESVCVSIILTGLVVGSLACWIISTFIQPVFTSQNSTYKACTPEPVSPSPPATTPPNPTAPLVPPPATTPPPRAPVQVTPIAGASSPPGLVNNYNLLKTATSHSSHQNPSFI